jgi:hypothetical protein
LCAAAASKFQYPLLRAKTSKNSRRAAASKFHYPLLRAKIHGAPLLRVVLSVRRCENQKKKVQLLVNLKY